MNPPLPRNSPSDRSATTPRRRWALITGASGGIGKAFADLLAARGLNLCLTGRNTDALAAVAEVARARGVEVEILAGDLSRQEFRDDLLKGLAQRGIVIDTLINNAGFGMVGPLEQADEDKLAEMVRLNVEALTDLTRACLPAMLEAGRGSIINVASTAAFQPLAGMAAYAASKSYVVNFTAALWHETRGRGVGVLAVCPGPTETGFFHAVGDPELLPRGRRTPEQVVRTAFDALAAGRPIVVDGSVNRLGSIAARVVPSRLAIEIGARVVGR